MSEPGKATGSERPCGLSSLLPIGMSCRGRAEAFARRLQSRLRTLGTQVNQNKINNKKLSKKNLNFKIKILAYNITKQYKWIRKCMVN